MIEVLITTTQHEKPLSVTFKSSFLYQKFYMAVYGLQKDKDEILEINGKTRMTIPAQAIRSIISPLQTLIHSSNQVPHILTISFKSGRSLKIPIMSKTENQGRHRKTLAYQIIRTLLNHKPTGFFIEIIQDKKHRALFKHDDIIYLITMVDNPIENLIVPLNDGQV